ncbi:MAG TPA: hypothetical protein PK336_06980, partial [Methanoculleus sp.]|nr:hypothetical protein [Methanoculleus sp.]
GPDALAVISRASVSDEAPGAKGTIIRTGREGNTSCARAVTAAEAGAWVIMLDNMTPEDVKAAVEALKREGLRERVTLEVSGGVDGADLAVYAATGVDIISMGALTHTVRNFDVSLDILKGVFTVRLE